MFKHSRRCVIVRVKFKAYEFLIQSLRLAAHSYVSEFNQRGVGSCLEAVDVPEPGARPVQVPEKPVRLRTLLRRA
jgi:hypothetical protein